MLKQLLKSGIKKGEENETCGSLRAYTSLSLSFPKKRTPRFLTRGSFLYAIGILFADEEFLHHYTFIGEEFKRINALCQSFNADGSVELICCV